MQAEELRQIFPDQGICHWHVQFLQDREVQVLQEAFLRIVAPDRQVPDQVHHIAAQDLPEEDDR